jgi:hypothetical protein
MSFRKPLLEQQSIYFTSILFTCSNEGSNDTSGAIYSPSISGIY